MNPRQSRREDTDFRILKLVQEKPDITQRELADALGLSLGAINYCLKALLDRGQIKMRNFSKSERKLTYAYLLTPSGFSRKAELTARFLKRKMNEYEQLKAEIEDLQREMSPRSAEGATSSEPRQDLIAE
jgi:EPS-associated MarR family transcriptional regulator